MAEGMVRNNLRLITNPTGGRLFQVSSGEQVTHAFAQIENELRNQYVLTYHTDKPPEIGKAPVVKVLQKGMKVKSALPLDLVE